MHMSQEKEQKHLQVLLLGNGINQLNGGKSWNEFLRDITTKQEILDGIIQLEKLQCPEPLKAILVTEDHIDVAMKNYCKKIAFEKQSPQICEIYKTILTMGFDDILTTNYTYELEVAAAAPKEINESKVRAMARNTLGRRVENKYLLHTYNCLKVLECENRVWHIHGEARKPDSTVLGHYYYGNLLFKIKKFLERRKYAYITESESWIDSFIMGDVYILGFGFAFSEMDLWWLLNRKAREKSDVGKVYFYEAKPDGFNEKQEILRMMKRASDGEPLVEIIDCGFDEKELKTFNDKYEAFYKAAIEDIYTKMNKG